MNEAQIRMSTNLALAHSFVTTATRELRTQRKLGAIPTARYDLVLTLTNGAVVRVGTAGELDTALRVLTQVFG